MKKLFLITMISILCAVTGFADGFKNFVTRDGGTLMDGNSELRFVSFNIPNLHYVEDDVSFTRTMDFRMPDAFEIRDALETIRQMGGQVARIYTLSTFQKGAPTNLPKHVLAPGKFNEEAFLALDEVLSICHEKQVRIIIPFVDNWKWWGGIADYAAFRGKEAKAFWTDPEIIADFKKTIHFMLNRVNTVTGIAYKDDKAILAWETGNEVQCPHSWTREIIAYIKSIDPNHLVIDGHFTSVLKDDSINDDLVDIVQTHHYENDPRQMLEHIRVSAEKVNGEKPYFLGEFGFISTEATRAVLNTVIEENLTGALIWSLRYRHKDGGFFWHSEPAGGDFFKAYHWPGFPSGEIYDESMLMQLMREKAFVIQGKKVPVIQKPTPPVLLPIEHVSAISWQGSTGASGYDIERSEKKGGSWRTVAYNVSDARYAYRPLFSDQSAVIGKQYYYRVRARNEAGISKPSQLVGPVDVRTLSLVDEFENYAKLFYRSPKLTISRNEARRYKEDAHRLDGEDGEWVLYAVPGGIQQCQIYTFAESGDAQLKMSVSTDGKRFIDVETTLLDYAEGKGEYGYLHPVLYQVKNVAGAPTFLRIEFTGKASLSRVEILYGE